MYCLYIDGKENAYKFETGKNLLEILRSIGISIEAPCGGKGTCGKCKVKILKGSVSVVTEEEKKHLSKEEKEEGIRLACLTLPLGDIIVDLLDQKEYNHKILTDGYMPDFKIYPAVSKKLYKLRKPTLENNVAYEDSLKEIFEKDIFSDELSLLRSLPDIFKYDEVTAVYQENKIIGIEPKCTGDEIYGVAVDIGTTTVVVSLVDLNKNREIASETAINPQKEYGLDVLSRIDFVKRKEEGITILQNAIIDCLNDLIKKLCNEYDISSEKIYEAAIAANATMMHLLLGIDTDSIGKAPYTTVFSKSKNFKASSIGLKISPFGRVYCLPGVSSYIGADIVAGALVSKLEKTDKNILFIDIGTNGEIVLSKKGKLSSCSCAAGPALEGMNISCGMRAKDGAIEGIKIKEKHIDLKVIGDKEPLGLCGSGILEAVSEILKAGLMNQSGRIQSTENVPQHIKRLLIEEGKKRKILIHEENRICITQGDIRQVQLAKGAILSGFYALLDLMEINMDDLDEVIIAGQFGKHLTVESLVGVGIIPKELSKKVKYIGNSSKTGALMCLLSREIREELERLAKKIHYFELSTKPDYEGLFTRCLSFPKV